MNFHFDIINSLDGNTNSFKSSTTGKCIVAAEHIVL